MRLMANIQVVLDSSSTTRRYPYLTVKYGGVEDIRPETSKTSNAGERSSVSGRMSSMHLREAANILPSKHDVFLCYAWLTDLYNQGWLAVNLFCTEQMLIIYIPAERHNNKKSVRYERSNKKAIYCDCYTLL